MRSYLPILLVIIFQSCNKFVDIEPAPELIETQELFTNDATAVSAVNGVYALIRESSPSLAWMSGLRSAA